MTTSMTAKDGLDRRPDVCVYVQMSNACPEREARRHVSRLRVYASVRQLATHVALSTDESDILTKTSCVGDDNIAV